MRSRLTRLSPREEEVAHLLSRAQSNSEIARTLGVTYGTVKEYISHIMRKLHLRNRVEVAVWYLARPKA